MNGMVLQKVNFADLKKDEVCYVWGKLRKQFTHDEDAVYKNFPGRKMTKVAHNAVRDKDKDGIIWMLNGGDAVFENITVKARRLVNKIEEAVAAKIEKTPLEQLKDIMKEIRKSDEKGEIQARIMAKSTYDKTTRNVPMHRGVTLIGFVIDGEVMFSNNTACHAGMNLSYEGRNFKKIEYLVSYITSKGQKLNKEAIAYYHWLFNFSAWKDCFITKDVEEAYETGIVFDTANPGNLIGGAAFATRWPTEHPDRTASWYQFYSNGVDPSIALNLSHAFAFSKGEFFYSPCDGHAPMAASLINKSSIENFMNKKVPDRWLQKALYCDTKSYSQVNQMWKGDEANYVRWADIFDGFKNNAVNKGKVNNPFGIIAPKISEGKTLQFYNFIAKWVGL